MRRRSAFTSLLVLAAGVLSAQFSAPVPAQAAEPAAAQLALSPTPYQGWNTYFGLGGDFTEQSLYGIYTAGTQASGVSAADNQPLADVPGTGSPLGTLGGSTTAGDVSYSNAISGYQAYYPLDGGNLTLSAQGAVTGYYIAASGGVPDSNAVGDWLWRQGGDEIGAGDRAEFRADEDRGTFFLLSFHEPAFGGDPCSGPAGDGCEGEAGVLLRLLDTRRFQVF